jgi:hypothetical protein
MYWPNKWLHRQVNWPIKILIYIRYGMNRLILEYTEKDERNFQCYASILRLSSLHSIYAMSIIRLSSLHSIYAMSIFLLSPLHSIYAMSIFLLSPLHSIYVVSILRRSSLHSIYAMYTRLAVQRPPFTL